MQKYILSSFLVISFLVSAAQNRTRDFAITLPEQRISNSLYSRITVIDGRFDTSHMGVVQMGAFNARAKVIPVVPFPVQLQNVLQGLTDSSASAGELLLHLHQLSFAEVTGAVSERGYYYFSADLYARNNDSYQMLGKIDTVVMIKAMDVTKALFRHGSNTIHSFLGQHLQRKPASEEQFSYDDILNMAEIEKKKIKLYTTDAYVNGIYNSYTSFFSQVPDRQATVEMKKGNISKIRITDSTGKIQKLSSDDIYAVVHEGIAYIATEYGYYLLRKENSDFYFIGKAKVTASTGSVVAASMFFGVIGGLIASNAHADFEMKIDHRNGGFVRLREIVVPAQ